MKISGLYPTFDDSQFYSTLRVIIFDHSSIGMDQFSTFDVSTLRARFEKLLAVDICARANDTIKKYKEKKTKRISHSTCIADIIVSGINSDDQTEENYGTTFISLCLSSRTKESSKRNRFFMIV